MRDKPSLKPPPRKNLRGFACHVWGLINRLVREEFPELAPVEVGLYGPSFMAKDALAQWNEWVLPDGRVLRCISLCAAGSRETHPFYLLADDEELRVILRHELIHGEMKRRGQPWGDRRYSVDQFDPQNPPHARPSSPGCIAVPGEVAFDPGSGCAAPVGSGRSNPPPPETEPILLPENAGVWLRKKDGGGR